MKSYNSQVTKFWKFCSWPFFTAFNKGRLGCTAGEGQWQHMKVLLSGCQLGWKPKHLPSQSCKKHFFGKFYSQQHILNSITLQITLHKNIRNTQIVLENACKLNTKRTWNTSCVSIRMHKKTLSSRSHTMFISNILPEGFLPLGLIPDSFRNVFNAVDDVHF